MPYISRISGGLLVLSGAYVAYYWVSLLSGNAESGPVLFMQSLQRVATNLILGLGERVWFAVGAALTVAAVIVLVRRRLRTRMPEDDALAELDGLEQEMQEERSRRSRSER